MTGQRRRRRVPVLVLPGWGASDLSTIPLRTQLGAIGHPVHRWQLGRNDRAASEIIQALGDRFADLHRRHERPIAIVGWSLGGIYACHLANRFPAEVKQIITLGSPLRSPMGVDPPPSIPMTSIWSRNDRIVDWRRSAIDDGPLRENIEVRATHLTIGVDPLVVAAIADRLAQHVDRWKAFRPPPLLRAAYSSGRSDP